jgi:phosphopantothenoylcysteine decarboxylase/phosphopantothenate--cysteine ligase
MGYKIAEEALKRRHKVTLISGPTNLIPPRVDKIIFIKTADDLLTELKKKMRHADCLIMCAAVSDFKSKRIYNRKIKRSNQLTIELMPNKDILSELRKFHKRNLFIGFSLETEALIKNAYLKLKHKNLDLIVANILTKHNNPFNNNKLDVVIIDRYKNIMPLRAKSKAFISHVLLDKIEELWYLKNTV